MKLSFVLNKRILVKFVERLPYQEFQKTIARNNYDFALVPLAGKEDPNDLKFNLSKSPFKYLNYGAAAIPAIFSSGTIYDKLISNGKNGLLVQNNAKAWMYGMEQLTKSSSLRKKIAANASNDVKNNFHIKFATKKLFALFNEKGFI